jgi:hypothetical protein
MIQLSESAVNIVIYEKCLCSSKYEKSAHTRMSRLVHSGLTEPTFQLSEIGNSFGNKAPEFRAMVKLCQMT